MSYDDDIDFLETQTTRRDLLKRAGVLGATLALAPVAAAYGADGETRALHSLTQKPKRGGHLRIGLVGGSAKDTADPHLAPFIPDDAINWLMFQGLVEFDPRYTPKPMLAEEVSANARATVWTVKLKRGILWHNGKPLTADDVVYSFRRILDPKNPKSGASALRGLKPSGVNKVDARTVRFHLEEANAIFGTDGLGNRLVHVVPRGFNPRKPIGTGPWKLASFRPGDRFVFQAFKDYHGGAPYLDKVTLIEFADPTARINALLSGAIDAMVELPPSQINTVKTKGAVPLSARSGGWIPFRMRIDQKPFDDVRVRQAFRLIVDRKQVLLNAFSNAGWLGNDMYSPFDKGYPRRLTQRHQDLEKARSLLKQAGYGDGLNIALITSEAASASAIPMAAVFAQQAKGAGVNVTVKAVDASVIFGAQYLDWTFAVSNWGYRNYLQQAATTSTPDSPFNETHWKDAQWAAIVTKAFATVDDAKRNELVRQAETIEYNKGGYIIPNFKNTVDAYSNKLAGFVKNDVMGIPLGRWRLQKVYFK
jgi:peptide/nickel transport system substrate-binding protein